MDIEGTISDIHFVKEVLFPYSASELRNFVASHKTNAKVRACLADAAKAAQSLSASGDEAAILQLLDWIKNDVKHPALKTLQGLIWQKGFQDGVFRSHLYEDVVTQWPVWQKQGLRLGIYSSGSVDAQKLFFEYSIAGNVLPFLEAHFDLATGPKKERASYSAICDQLHLAPKQILFLSDIEAELDAASAAGLQTALVAREASKTSQWVTPGRSKQAQICSLAELILNEGGAN